MNYMDFTNDDCMNMFTEGQKLRARNLFISGGARESILSSKGLSEPTNFSEPAEVTDPQWMEPKLYPNPAKGIITLDLEYDTRWIGYNVRITDISGRLIMQRTISSGKEQIDVSKLNPGMYMIWAKSREDKFQIKFIKQ